MVPDTLEMLAKFHTMENRSNIDRGVASTGELKYAIVFHIRHSQSIRYSGLTLVNGPTECAITVLRCLAYAAEPKYGYSEGSCAVYTT